MVPYYPSGDGEGIPFTINTARDKTVADYARISLFDVARLEIFDYWALLRDAVIFNRSQTKKGREWLENAHDLAQTEPDMPGLRKFVQRGG